VDAWDDRARSTSSSRGSSGRIESFRTEHGLEKAAVSVELADGSLHRLATISPGARLRLRDAVPHCDEGEPEQLIVPLGAIREIRIGVPDGEHRLGYSLSSA
jgi:hypothetical protein